MNIAADPLERENAAENFSAVSLGLRLTGLLLLQPFKKRTKNDARGPYRVEIYRKIVPGLELTAKYQRALERAGYYPNSNRRPTVSDSSLFR